MTSSRTPLISILALQAACLTWQVYGTGESCDITNLRQSSGLDKCLQEITTEANVVDSQLVPSGSQLQVYMDLVFHTTEDVFPYCCDAFHAPAADYRLNPLSGDNPPNYKLRVVPTARFFIKAGASVAVGDSNYYMMAVFDIGTPGEPWVHWMKGNIRGLDLTGSGEDWYPYVNLVVPANHMFVLYQQASEFTSAITDYGAPNNGLFCIQSRCDFNIEQLIKDNNMQLLAASWVQPTRTEYIRYSQLNKLGLPLSTVCTDQVDSDIVVQGDQVICPSSKCDKNLIQNDQELQECLDLIKSAISRHADNFFSASEDLQVYMEATYRVQEYDVTACCLSEHYEASFFHLKSLENGRPPTSALVNPPEMHFYPLSSSGVAKDDGMMYTLALLDIVPDEFDQFSTPTRPFLHWLVVNIPGLQVQTGDTIYPYYPPVGDSRTFIFVLYRQKDSLPTDIKDLDSLFAPPEDCYPSLPYGCRFDAAGFMSQYNLEKLGGAYFFPRESLFPLSYQPRRMGIDESLICEYNGLTANCLKSHCEGGSQMDVDKCLQSIEEVGAVVAPHVLPAAGPLTVYPELTFVTRPINIVACCLSERIMGQTLVHNPLDGKQQLTVSYHSVPSLSIRGPVPSGLLTLLVIDGTFVHWAVVNIQDGQLSSGDEFRSLFYPAVGHVHSVLLLQQNSPITSSQFESYSDSSRCPPPPAFNGRCGFNWPKFINDLDLKLIGFNWIHPKNTKMTQMVNLINNWGQSEDQFCPEETDGWVQVEGGQVVCPSRNCGGLVLISGNVASCLEKVYEVGRMLSAFVASVDKLPVYLDVNYNNDPYTFSVCCKTHNVSSNRVTLNPLSMSQHPEGYFLKQVPDINFIVPPEESANPLVSKSSNDFYLLLLADVQGDLPTLEMWSQDKPFVHWLVINIAAMDVAQGEELVSYMPPTAPSKHMFLLFNQNRAKIGINLADYAGRTCYPSNKVKYRCNFNLPQLIFDYDLTLVGISPMKPGPSQYMDWSIINNLGFSPADICDPNHPPVTGPCGQSCDIVNIRQNSGLKQCLQELATEAHEVDPQLVPDGTQLQVYMDLVFHTREQVFPYCCDAFPAPAASYRLNPLSLDNPLNYKLRVAPLARFFVKDGASVAVGDDNFYMIAAFDIGTIGQPWVHWMKGNIRGLDLEGSGEDWYPYGNLVMGVNHMFVLYRQGSEFTGTATDYGAPDFGPFCIKRKCDFDIEKLIIDNNMELLSVAWVQPTRTEYIRHSQLNNLGLPLSAVCVDQVDPDIVVQGDQLICPASKCELHQIQTNQGLQGCLGLVTSAISRHAANFFNATDKLQVYMEATYRVQEYDVTLCCVTKHFEADYFQLKPLENGRPPTSVLVNPPQMHFYPTSNSNIAMDDGQLYTLLMMDIIADVNGEYSTPTRPFLHWMVVNIPGLQVQAGDEIYPYYPPGGNSFTYLFVLYRQTGTLPTDIKELASVFAPPEDCYTLLPYGCRFDVTTFASQYNLAKLGGMWFFPTTTLFSSSYHPRRLGYDESAACGSDGLPSKCLKSICDGGSKMDVDLCLRTIEKEGAKVVPEVLPAAALLMVYPELTFTTQDRVITDCCLNQTIKGEILVHNPLDGKQHLIFKYHAVPSLTIHGPVPDNPLTLLMMDETFVHWAVVNIENGDLHSGDQYRSMVYPAVGHIHSILLFEQSSRISRFQFESYSDPADCFSPPAFTNRCGFNWAKFANDFDLVLIGVNWIHPQRTKVTQMVNLRENWGHSQEDICPEQTDGWVQMNEGQLQCPGEICSNHVVSTGNVKQCLEKVYEVGSKLSAFVASVDKLPVYLNVKYSNEQFTFEACCQQHTISSNQFTLDPLSMTQHPEGYYLSQAPALDFIVPPQESANVLVGKSNNDFYMLLLADVQGDLPTLEMWSQDKPFVHWLVINIASMDLAQGEEIASYMPPTAPSKHMFLLFRQNRARIELKLADYAGSTCYPSDKVKFRCNFNLPRLIFDYDLTLVGISPMKPGPSQYMDWSIINNLGFSPADICDSNDPAVTIKDGKLKCTSDEKPPTRPSAAHNLVGSMILWMTALLLTFFRL